MATTEVKLPPIDAAKTPPSSAFDPSIFAARKEGTIIPPEPVREAEPDKAVTPAPATTPIVSEAEKQAANLLAEEMEQQQKRDDELKRAAEEAEKEKKDEESDTEKGKKVEKKDEVEVEQEKETEVVEEKPELKPLQRKTKPAPTEEEELGEFPEDLQPFAKKMARDARQKVLSKFKQYETDLAEAKAKGGVRQDGLPESYFMHEKGYTLDPAYDQSNKVLSQAQWEANYWKGEFAKVRAGEKQWNDLALNAQGQLVTVPRDADAMSETDLITRIGQANTLVQQHTANLNYLAQSHKQRMEKGMSGIREMENQFFPQFSEEKAFKAHKKFAAIDGLLSTRGMKSVVPTSTFTKLFLAAQDMEEYIAELEAKGAKPVEEETTTKAPTAAAHKGGVGKKSGSEDPNDKPLGDAFERRKREAGR